MTARQSIRTRPVIVCAAGGTGGHVFPAEALAAAVLARGGTPVLFTDRRGGSYGAGIEVVAIAGGGIHGLKLGEKLVSIAKLSAGAFTALAALRQLKPDAVVGFGGYAALPTLLAARLLGLPAAIHEQNAVLGRANRLLAPRVRLIATAFAATAAVPAAAAAKVRRVGMPVRPAFAPARAHPYQPPSAHGPLRLLVLGGSQGAQVFSELLPAAVALLPDDLRRRLAITQQCRPETLAATAAAYAAIGLAPDLAPELAAFFADVPERLAAAHLVVARSGASTVAELTAVGRPAIFVPYPYAIDDHQTANAAAVAETGGGWLMPQAALSPDALAAELTRLFIAPDALADAAAAARAAGVADAAERLAELAWRLAERPGEVKPVLRGGLL
jgi:UDP-N-acetylglucosamine--N-acetylmuramyl-(pentapeptide) pyrophosphoryl-undecaprenol N-acetylglucosamine transferase